MVVWGGHLHISLYFIVGGSVKEDKDHLQGWVLDCDIWNNFK